MSARQSCSIRPEARARDRPSFSPTPELQPRTFSLQATTSKMEEFGPPHAVSALSLHKAAIPSLHRDAHVFKINLRGTEACRSDWPRTGWFDDVHWRALYPQALASHTPHARPAVLAHPHYPRNKTSSILNFNLQPRPRNNLARPMRCPLPPSHSPQPIRHRRPHGHGFQMLRQFLHRNTRPPSDLPPTKNALISSSCQSVGASYGGSIESSSVAP